MKDLTPKARYLYKRAVHLKRKNLFLKQSKILLKTKLRHPEKNMDTLSSMDRIRSRFFESQVENLNRTPRGRRYTLEDKILALALQKQSGRGYRFLSKVFNLPSRKTISKLLNRIPLSPGIHEEVFALLKAEVKNFKNPLDKFIVLMFDEVCLQPNLQPNIRQGFVEGFEDFGFKQSEKIANHAQVTQYINKIS